MGGGVCGSPQAQGPTVTTPPVLLNATGSPFQRTALTPGPWKRTPVGAAPVDRHPQAVAGPRRQLDAILQGVGRLHADKLRVLVLGHVRQALSDAGFEVLRSPGFGRKRHMSRGRLRTSAG